jgi:hypothetical protein
VVDANDPAAVSSKKRFRLALLLGAIAVTSPIWFPFAYIATKIFSEPFHVRSFDSVEWKNSLSDKTNRVRLQMVDDLLASGRLIGLTRAEVIATLGVPPQTNYFREYDFVYWLGLQRGFAGIDSEWLVIKLDDDGRVREAKLVND